MEYNEWRKELEPLVYNWDRMQNRMMTSISSYEEMLEKRPNTTVQRINSAPNALSWSLIDNGADILGVAHLDATGIYPHFAHARVGGPQGDEIVWARWVDDRLGVFLLLDVLAPLFKYDILLTTGEESGQSTAKQFVPPAGKKYRWMFEADRTGEDVVHYQYDTPQMLAALREAGFFRPSHGSFTDISALGSLGCAGFNFGIGYDDYHTDAAYANLTVTINQCARFAAFYTKNAEVDFPYDPKVVTHYYGQNTWTSPAVPALNSAIAEDKRFVADQIVLEISTGAIGAVSATWVETGTDKIKWWVRFPDPARNGLAASGRYVLEDDLEPDLSDVEIARAQDLFLKDTYYRYKIKVRNAVRDNITMMLEYAKPVVDKPVTVNVDNVAELKRLLLLCDGPMSEETLAARAKYEHLTFGRLRNSSRYRPTLVDEKRIEKEMFFRDEYVNTPSGIGVIDCNWPCLPFTEEPHWWVRFTIPDAEGCLCDLLAASSLTSRAAPRILN